MSMTLSWLLAPVTRVTRERDTPNASATARSTASVVLPSAGSRHRYDQGVAVPPADCRPGSAGLHPHCYAHALIAA